jgi:hypothetical protein
MKKIIYIFLCIPVLTFSAPAYKGEMTFKQQDGSSFRGYLKGDEWFNWIEDKQAHVVKYNSVSHAYEYGVIKEVNGSLDLFPSGIKVEKQFRQVRAEGDALPQIPEVDKKVLVKIWQEKKRKAAKYRLHIHK